MAVLPINCFLNSEDHVSLFLHHISHDPMLIMNSKEAMRLCISSSLIVVSLMDLYIKHLNQCWVLIGQNELVLSSGLNVNPCNLKSLLSLKLYVTLFVSMMTVDGQESDRSISQVMFWRWQISRDPPIYKSHKEHVFLCTWEICKFMICHYGFCKFLSCAGRVQWDLILVVASSEYGLMQLKMLQIYCYQRSPVQQDTYASSPS